MLTQVLTLANLRLLYMHRNSLAGPLPDAVGMLVKLELMNVERNELQGLLPHDLQYCVQLSSASFNHNTLSSSIPQAVNSLARLGHHFALDSNALRGAIPDAINALSLLQQFRLGDNKLEGAIPCAVETLAQIKDLWMGNNMLAGSAPVAIRSLDLTLGTLRVSGNRLSGSIFESIGLSLGSLEAHRNIFQGSIPDAVASNTDMRAYHLQENALSGTIPAAILVPNMMFLTLDSNSFAGSIPLAFAFWMDDGKGSKRIFSASQNQLSGSMEGAVARNLPESLILNDNHLTGTLAWPRKALRLVRLAHNRFEGLIPEMMDVSDLRLLDLSGEASSRTRLKGPLPAGFGRAKKLLMWCSGHHDLGGAIPPFKSTLGLLALHNNGFKAFQCANFDKDGIALLFNNLLSCHLPECAGVSLSLSVSLLGNRVQKRSQTFPDWVQQRERNSLFLSKGYYEGVAFMLQISGGSACLASVIAMKLGRQKLAGIMAKWHGRGSHESLALASSRMIYCMASSCLVRTVSLLQLVCWERYICPPVFAMASACLRGSRVTHILVLAMWCHFTFLSPTVRCLTTLKGSQEAAAKNTIRRSFLWLAWCFVTLLFSAGSILSQAGSSVPGLMQEDNHAVAALKFCVSAFQGLLTGLVMPGLAGKLSSKKYALTTVSALLMNVLFPAAVVFYLDTGCLARWVVLWPECSTSSSAQFRKVVRCYLQDRPQAHKDTTCVQVPQREPNQGMVVYWEPFKDFWLKKLVVAAVLLPAGRIAADKWYPGLAEGTSKLVILLAYAIAASGHLPIVIPVLLLGMLSETLMTAGSLHVPGVQGDKDIGFATQGLLVTQVSSIALHLAFASGDLVALGLLIAFVLSLLHRLEAVRSRAERPERLSRPDGS